MSSDMYSICQYVSQLLDVPSFDDLIINGLQVEGTRKVQCLATAVSANLYTIEEAIRHEVDLLLTHHGLFVKPGMSEIRGVQRHRLEKLLRSGMHLLSYHLPLDAHPQLGNAWPVAERLNWRDVKPFGLYGRKYLGVKGQIDSVQSGTLFQALRDFWRAPGVYVGPGKEELISSCAFVSGAGPRFVEEAVAAGIECFITGTIDDRAWDIVRETNIHYMAFGHIATEKTGVQLLGNHLASHFGLRHVFIDEENPF